MRPFILFALSVFTLFRPAAVRAADPSDAALDPIIDRLLTTFKAGDYTYAVDVMYKPFLDAAGGRQAALDAIAPLAAQMKAMNVKMVSYETKKPYQFASTATRRYAVIPYSSVIEISGKTVRQSCYQLGIKEGGSPWQLMNGDTLTPEVYQRFFPDFPKSLTLPKLERTVE